MSSVDHTPVSSTGWASEINDWRCQMPQCGERLFYDPTQRVTAPGSRQRQRLGDKSKSANPLAKRTLRGGPGRIWQIMSVNAASRCGSET